MTLLFVDSFDHYATAQLLQKWTGAGPYGSETIAAVGRNGTNGVRMADQNSALRLGLIGAPGTLIAGVYLNPPSLGAAGPPALLSMEQNGIEQIGVRLNATSGLLYVTRNGVSVGDSSYVAHVGVGLYLELKVIFAVGAAGTVVVRANGATIFNQAAIVTAPSGNAWGDVVALRGMANGAVGYDDFYLCNGAGAINNDFLGDVRIQALLPDGPGNYTQWNGLVGAAAHWQAVNDNPPDDDATYVSDTLAVPGAIDSFTLGNVTPTSGTVPGIQVIARARKDDAGVRTVATMVRSAAVDALGANVNLGNQYGFVSQIFELDPGAAAWSIAKVNALEAGIKAVA